MNQYGYIPFENISKLKIDYKIANPSTWIIERIENDANGETTIKYYGGVEEFQFSEEQINEILSLGGYYFNSANEFRAWLYEFGEVIII